MHRTLGISPKVILPLIGHAAVAIALLVSGHTDLAWQYAASSLPVTGVLGFLAHAGTVLPVDVGGAAGVDAGESFATEPFEAPAGDVASVGATDPSTTAADDRTLVSELLAEPAPLPDLAAKRLADILRTGSDDHAIEVASGILKSLNSLTTSAAGPTLPYPDDRPLVLTDEQVAMIARQVATALTAATH